MNSMDYKERGGVRSSGGTSRWLYFFLGVFLAASIGLAIALIINEVNDDDDCKTSAVLPNQGANAANMGQGGIGGAATQNPITQAPQTQTPVADDDKLCLDASCVLRAGELLQAVDRTADPCEDFYQYACGTWTSRHSIPEAESQYSRFGEIRDNVRLQLKGLLEKPYDASAESDSIRKAKALYASCMDEDAMTKLGAKPLKDMVASLGPWSLTDGRFSTNGLEHQLLALMKVGVDPLLGIWVGQDERNSSANIPWVDQPGFGMARDYLVKGLNSSEVKAYQNYLQAAASKVLTASNPAALEKDIEDVVSLEIELAKLTPTRAERRNSENFYNKVTVSELQSRVPMFNWTVYLTGFFQDANITVNDNMEVILFAEKYLNDMLKLINSKDQRVLSNYMLMRLVDGHIGHLSKEFRDLGQPLREVLYGITQVRARWKTCVDAMGSSYMPTAVGQLYVKTYFSGNAKSKADEMIGYLRESINTMISDVTWMDDATKQSALEKLAAIIQKIGYPDYQFNETFIAEYYKRIDYKNNTWFDNGMQHTQAGVIESALNLKRTPKRSDWSASASTVNAFYSPNNNAITFPAGILNPPFYGSDFPMSMMFGGIGMVIGHEITHGFDDQGRKVDKDGNQAPWWSNSSVNEFEKLTPCFVDLYGRETVVGQHVNGHLTLGENIADNGGIKAAFMAFKKWQAKNGKQPRLPGLGLTHEQLFFVNFAQGWCDLITDQQAINRLLTDPHSPAKLRVKVTAANSPYFAEAFKCKKGTPMNPDKRCTLW